ncbi:hypothetical protein LINPERPRIM_LOCUS37836 [Linum perenne]
MCQKFNQVSKVLSRLDIGCIWHQICNKPSIPERAVKIILSHLKNGKE